MSEVKTPYERIGGEQAVRELCQTFYQIMCETPQTQLIRAMHPENIGISEEKLYLFLTGWSIKPLSLIQFVSLFAQLPLAPYGPISQVAAKE